MLLGGTYFLGNAPELPTHQDKNNKNDDDDYDDDSNKYCQKFLAKI